MSPSISYCASAKASPIIKVLALLVNQASCARAGSPSEWLTQGELAAGCHVASADCVSALKEIHRLFGLELIPGNGLAAHRYRMARIPTASELESTISGWAQHTTCRAGYEPENSPQEEAQAISVSEGTGSVTVDCACAADDGQDHGSNALAQATHGEPAMSGLLEIAEVADVADVDQAQASHLAGDRPPRRKPPAATRNRSGRFSGALSEQDSALGALSKLDVVSSEPVITESKRMVVVDLHRRPGSSRIAISMSDAILIGQMAIQSLMRQRSLTLSSPSAGAASATPASSMESAGLAAAVTEVSAATSSPVGPKGRAGAKAPRSTASKKGT